MIFPSKLILLMEKGNYLLAPLPIDRYTLDDGRSTIAIVLVSDPAE
jgi:hypothetical protein